MSALDTAGAGASTARAIADAPFPLRLATPSVAWPLVRGVSDVNGRPPPERWKSSRQLASTLWGSSSHRAYRPSMKSMFAPVRKVSWVAIGEGLLKS